MNASSTETAARDASPPEVGHLLIFAMEGQEFALALRGIVEVVPYRRPTPVPGAEPGILGILPIRGKMVTVIDGRRLLGLPERNEVAKKHVIVLEDGGEPLGLVVETLARVAAIPGDTEPLPASLRIERPDRFAGVVRRDGGYILLVNLEALLRDAR